MDPNEALRRIISTLRGDRRATEADIDVIDGLVTWLENGGFRPDNELRKQFAKASGTSGYWIERDLRKVQEQWELEVDDEDPVDEDDVPWFRYTYGVLPTKEIFERNYKALLGSRGEYTYHLKGDDRRCFNDLELDPGPTEVDADDLWDIIETLVDAWDQEDGDETAGDIASGILQTLHIEWI